MKWKLPENFPQVKKCVIIVAPHTSWHDFIIGLLVRSIVKEKVHFIGKDSLFKWPYGWYFRWLGGTPVDRSQHNDLVASTVQIFKEREEFRLALSPEGTRKRVTKWKTGFYYIAKQANVPIVMIGLDFGNKQVLISRPYDLTGDKDRDIENCMSFFRGIEGKIKEYSVY